MAMNVLFAVASFAASVAAAAGATAFHYAAHLGSTTAVVDAWAKPATGENFRVGGHLVVKNGSATLLSADPWKLSGGEENGVVAGTAVSIDGLDLAALDDAPYPNVLLRTSGCGANCSGGTTVLAYVTSSQTYRTVPNGDSFYGQLGDVVSRGGRQYVDATLASPFFDCHACGEGTTKLLVRVDRNRRLVDEMANFPDLLRADAQQAWNDYLAAVKRGQSNDEPPFEDALFRYFADEVRLGNRTSATARLRALPKLHGEFDSFITQSNQRLAAVGIRE